MTLNVGSVVAAGLLALPNGVLIWLLFVVPVDVITGLGFSSYIHYILFLASCMLVLVWSLYEQPGLAEVIYRQCRLAMLLAVLLPFVTAVLLLLWGTGAVILPAWMISGRTLFEVLGFSSLLSILLVALALLGSYLAARHLRNVPF